MNVLGVLVCFSESQQLALQRSARPFVNELLIKCANEDRCARVLVSSCSPPLPLPFASFPAPARAAPIPKNEYEYFQNLQSVLSRSRYGNSFAHSYHRRSRCYHCLPFAHL